MMKKKLLLFFCILVLSCNSQNQGNLVVDNQLMSKISLIVSEYSNFYQKNQPLSDIDIYEVHFHKIGEDCYISINTNIFYNSTLDGFIMIDDNLITFNSPNDECKIFIHKTGAMKQDILSTFPNESEPIDNYNPAWWTFKIVGDSLVFDSQGRFKIDFEN